jgi:2-polyprenyl-6-methoxyphenol hydroxylase-like FAD-dependent oxidoreductase
MALLDSIADTRKEVAVIGAGPVGTLVAIYMARLGWKVSLYEARPGR